MSDWQPIETAPRDETEILLYFQNPDFDETRWVGSGWWEVNKTDCGEPAWTDGSTTPGGFFRSQVATHWQPLPAPPEPQTQTKAEGVEG